MIYHPIFNKVLVEIDDKDSTWGKSSDGSIGGVVYRDGRVLEIGTLLETTDYPNSIDQLVTADGTILDKMVGKQVMWHEGHEAGTVFEENGKKYALIFWWDLIGIRNDK